ALEIGVRLEISRVVRGGISATKVDVYAHGEKDLPREVFWEQHTDHPHDHDSSHEQSHAASHKHSGHDHVQGRGLTEIRAIIEKAAINATAKATAIRIFEALGEAEAEIQIGRASCR